MWGRQLWPVGVAQLGRYSGRNPSPKQVHTSCAIGSCNAVAVGKAFDGMTSRQACAQASQCKQSCAHGAAGSPSLTHQHWRALWGIRGHAYTSKGSAAAYMPQRSLRRDHHAAWFTSMEVAQHVVCTAATRR